MGNILLEVNDVTVHYEKVEAISGVSLAVEEGEIVTLIGNNGAGKTTLLKTINRILSVQKGEIFLEGLNLRQLPLRMIAR